MTETENLLTEAEIKQEISIVEDPEVPSILDSITQQQIDDFKPYYERYFEEKYCTKFSTTDLNLDTCIRVHSNKISVIFLSKKHVLVTKGSKIKSLNFQVSPKVNRLKNTMSGKRKRGAQLLSPDSVLFYVETEEGDVYPIHTGIYGKLLELNDNMVKNPNLIVENLCEGFMAIILPDIKKHEDNMKSLVSKEDYYNVKE